MCDVFMRSRSTWVTVERDTVCHVPAGETDVAVRACGLDDSDCHSLLLWAKTKIPRNLSTNTPVTSRFPPIAQPLPSAKRPAEEAIDVTLSPSKRSRAASTSPSPSTASTSPLPSAASVGKPFPSGYTLQVVFDSVAKVDNQKGRTKHVRLEALAGVIDIKFGKTTCNTILQMLRRGHQELWDEFGPRIWGDYLRAVKNLPDRPVSHLLPFQIAKPAVFLTSNPLSAMSATGLTVPHSSSPIPLEPLNGEDLIAFSPQLSPSRIEEESIMSDVAPLPHPEIPADGAHLLEFQDAASPQMDLMDIVHEDAPSPESHVEASVPVATSTTSVDEWLQPARADHHAFPLVQDVSHFPVLDGLDIQSTGVSEELFAEAAVPVLQDGQIHTATEAEQDRAFNHVLSKLSDGTLQLDQGLMDFDFDTFFAGMAAAPPAPHV